MCGINGIVRFNGHPVMRDELMNMNAKMVHRGPDDEGYYIDGNAGLSMRRLSIIDINTGHQPISNEDERYQVVLNGEIYNYVELRDELKKGGHRFRTDSDTEVLVHLYEESGERCLERLNGMFAFAIWDSHKREMFIASDRLGIKPLYYYLSDDLFCFSSELQSLLTVGFERQLDYRNVLLYIYLLYVPHPGSVIKNVRKLEPATYITINEHGEVTVKTYWGVEDIAPDANFSYDEFKVKFLAILSDAVKLQLRSDVPVGTFLSGGIDSSCVVAMLSKLGNGGPVTTFALGYEGHSIDERPFARQVAGMYKTEHRELYLTLDDVKNNFQRIVSYMDEPIGDTAAIPTFMLSEMARDSGVKVILNGTGGDEIFGGYRQYDRGGMEFGFKKNVNRVLNTLLAALQNPLDLQGVIKLNSPVIQYLCELSRSLIGMKSCMRDDRWTGLVKDLESSMSDKFDALNGLPEVDRLMSFDLKTYLVGDLFFLLDKMTMGASIEGRVPLVDHRMVEFMSSVPGRMRVEKGELKALVKRALEGVLPRDVLYRKKMGFGGPVESWLSGGLFDGMEIFDGQTSDFTTEVFRAGKVRQMLKEKKFGKLNAQWIYNLAVFELWYSNVFKGGGR